jgi:hypothetical protein
MYYREICIKRMERQIIIEESLKIEKKLDRQELHLYNNLACIFRDAYLI